MARSKNSTYLIGVETKALVTEPLVCVEMPPVEMFGVFSLFADGVFVLGETLLVDLRSGLSFCLSAGGRYSTSCFRFR